MKQMTLAEFVQLPPGAVFSFLKPCVADGLHVKAKSIDGNYGDPPNDFFYLPLLPHLDMLPHPCVRDRCESGDEPTPTMPDMLYRWGMYDFDQLFAVYEPDDVKALIAALSGTDPS